MDILTANYPEYTKLSDLQQEGQELESVIESVFALIENGVIMTKDPTKLGSS